MMAALCVLFTCGPAQADDEAWRAEQGAQLHKTAVAAARGGKWKTAIDRWRAAEALYPHWKYAFNLASALEHIGDTMTAWEAGQRAIDTGLPDSRRDQIDGIMHRLEERLFLAHAFLELDVQPAGATVTRDGNAWDGTRKGWTHTSASLIVVHADGYLPKTQLWRHPNGARATLAVNLIKAPMLARANVPAERPKGRAPGVAPTVMKRPKVVPAKKPKPVIKPRTPPEEGPDLGMIGWATLGSGVAVAAGGAGLIAWSGTLRVDGRGINQDASDWDQYGNEYDAAKSRYEAVQLGGWVMTGVGAAAAVTGAILLVIDSTRSSEEDTGTTTTLAPLPLAGGGGVSAEVRF